jgi:hypothetical protein
MNFTEEEKDLIIETLAYRLEEDSMVVRRETLREDLQELIRRFEEE